MIRVFLLFLFSALSGLDDDASGPRADKTQPAPIEFIESLAQAKRLAHDSGLPIVISFGTLWCDSCRLFKHETLSSPEVQELAMEFHWVYVEIDRNISLARSFGVRSTQELVVIQADGTTLGTAIGPLRPAELLAFLASAKRNARAAANGPEMTEATLSVAEFMDLTLLPSGYRGQAICFTHVGFGPLNVPSQSPAQILRLGLQPRTPSTLAKDQWELRWSESVANIFAYRRDDFRLDYLTLQSVLSLSYGVSDTFQVGLAYSDVTRSNSVLDPLVDGFHHGFGLGDSGRDEFEQGDNLIYLAPKQGVSIHSDRSGSESRDISLTLQHNLTCGSAELPAISYAIDARYHAGGGAQLRGELPLSVAVSTALARRFGDQLYTYVGLGYAWHGLDNARGLPLNDSQWSGLFALEWRYAERASWIIQYLVSEGVALDRDPFDKPSNEVNIGWKCEISAGTVLEIGLIENIIEVDNSPDFGIHFGLQYRF